ncbi:Hypothetical protein EAG7_02383 [Klebsiella aerogenes]|nr:Hypothetical protein EAG7_02383 [Klebsiella aerogenes]CCG30858.1 hypothetical protein [Klebsiella aerogenes EA1509E]
MPKNLKPEMEILNRMLESQIQESQNLARKAEQDLNEIKRQLEPYQFNNLMDNNLKRELFAL